MPDQMMTVFISTEAQERRILKLETALRRQHRQINLLATAGLLLVTMNLLLQKQIKDIKAHRNNNEGGQRPTKGEDTPKEYRSPVPSADRKSVMGEEKNE